MKPARLRYLLFLAVLLAAGRAGASTLNGSCRVTGFTLPSLASCEVTFTFTTADMSYSDCLSYKAALDGDVCRAAAPATSCNYTAGYVLSASCSGGGGGDSLYTGSWFEGGAFTPSPFTRVDPFAAEDGSAFFSGHYSSDFESWRDDAMERWRSYLARNALAKGAGIAIWPDGLFARSLEKAYALLAGSKKKDQQPASPFAEYDNAPVSKAQSDYEQGIIDPADLKRYDPVIGAGGGNVGPMESNELPFQKGCQNCASVAPGYSLRYSSLYGGQYEADAMRIERFPDGRAVYTDSSNTRWTFRPYGDIKEKGDSYYRPPLGASERLVYGDIKGGRGYRVETADGDVLEFSASASSNTWRPSRYNAADGSWLTYDYGPNGLARITDMHGRYFAFERDKRGLPLAVTDQTGKKTVFSYDGQGRAVGVTAPDGTSKTFAYDAAGFLRAAKNGALAEERYTYDDTGRVLTSESEGGVNRLEHYYYDASSKTVITDAFGSRTTYTYKTENGRKLTTSITDALGAKATLAYDGNYNIASATDQLGRATKFVRNANGDPERITDALGSTSTIQYQVKLQYRDAAGDHTDYYSRPIRITDALGRATKLDYDSYGNLDKTEDALGNKTSMAYDKAGHMLELRDALGNTYKYEYTMGLTRSEDPLGRVTRYKRDADLQVTQLTDPLGRDTTFTYDLGGNVTSVTNPLGFVTRFAYGNGACPSCGGSQLSALTDPKGNTWTFGYDKYGRLTDTANPLGQRKTYAYDKMSRVTEYKDPAGNVTTYTYDALNRLTKKDISTPAGAHSVTDYTYDAVGNLLNIANGDNSVSYTYDQLNRPIATTQSFGGKSYTIAYAYDPVGNSTAMTTPWGKYSYTYDALNRLTGIVNPQGITVGFTYDAVGRRTGKKIFKATPELLSEAEYTYDAAGQLLSITNKAGGKVVAFDKYTYDANGNRVLKEDQAGTTKYGYDKSNRLITAEPVPFDMARAEGFVYDRNGNRRFDRGAKDYKYDAANRVLNNSAYTYTHDQNGNLTTRTEIASSATVTYAYNPEQQLAEVVTPKDRLEYKYDPLGRRLVKSANGSQVYYVYDNEDILAMLDANGTMFQTFTHGPGIDEPLIMAKADGANYYYHADGLGSIVALTDDKKQVIEVYSYKSYGQPTIKDISGAIFDRSTISNQYLFTAREFDGEAELYYYRARYYDWLRGDFTQEDPIGFTGVIPNLYEYADASPELKSDSYGLYSCVYSVTAHLMVCTPNNIPLRAFQSSDFVSGNDGNLPAHEFPGPTRFQFQNNPGASNLPFIGPIPIGEYTVGRLKSPDSTRRPLTPGKGMVMPGRNPHSFQTHFCPNPNTCSEGCIAGAKPAIDVFNQLLSQEEGRNKLTVLP